MPKKLIGTESYQVPRNADLGTAAFQDAESVNITGGVISLGNSSTTGYFQDTAISDVKPSLMLDFANTKTLDPRITFTRASTATYYDGKTVAKSEENLLLYSNDFSQSVWNKSSTTIYSNVTVAPDGTLTASSLIPTATNNAFSLFQVITNNVATQTQSLYVKPNGYTKVMLRESNAGGNYVAFDISAGTILYDASGGTASITSVGNGWYRISMSCSYTAGATRFSLYILSSSYTTGSMQAFTADGISGIYVWGAQFESRLTLTSYTPTTSSPITNYIPVLQTAPANVARFDHDPVTGESKGLLIEESRTNLTIYSNDFSNSSWIKNNITISSNVIVAPDGTITGDKITETSSTSIHWANQIIQNLSASWYTFSIFAKKGENDKIFLSLAGGPYGSYPTGHFDLTNGTASIVTNTHSIITYIQPVGNGWYRCAISAKGSTTGNTEVQIFTSNGTTYMYTGDSTKGVYIWGAQFESGKNLTSYIPTDASQVTKSADDAYITGTNFSSLYNYTEGTLYVEQNIYNIDDVYANQGGASLYYDASNFITVGHGVGAATDGSGGGRKAGVWVMNSNSSVYFTTTNQYLNIGSKMSACISYSPSLISFSSNTQPLQSKAGPNTFPSLVNKLVIGHGYGGSRYYSNGAIGKIVYYPKRLSDAEVQEMTL